MDCNCVSLIVWFYRASPCIFKGKCPVGSPEDHCIYQLAYTVPRWMPLSASIGLWHNNTVVLDHLTLEDYQAVKA